MSVEETLSERNKTHGDFAENARISQALKTVMRQSSGWGNLPDAQKEALDVAALKISRILSGQNMFPDHWLDGSGYFTLGERACDAVKNQFVCKKCGRFWDKNHFPEGLLFREDVALFNHEWEPFR